MKKKISYYHDNVIWFYDLILKMLPSIRIVGNRDIKQIEHLHQQSISSYPHTVCIVCYKGRLNKEIYRLVISSELATMGSTEVFSPHLILYSHVARKYITHILTHIHSITMLDLGGIGRRSSRR